MAIERKISRVKDTHRHHHPLSISLSTARSVSSCQSSSTFTSYSSLTAVVLLLMATQLMTQVEGVWNHSCTVEQMASERNGFVCGANIPKTLQLVCGKRGTADRGQQPPCRGRRGKTRVLIIILIIIIIILIIIIIILIIILILIIIILLIIILLIIIIYAHYYYYYLDGAKNYDRVLATLNLITNNVFKTRRLG
jgi:ABC-type multidrug transport system fused ATPase/permease subunit